MAYSVIASGEGSEGRERRWVRRWGLWGRGSRLALLACFLRVAQNFMRGIKRREELVEGVEGRPALFREKISLYGNKERGRSISC